MAKAKRRTRRNPIKTTGALVVNPRRKTVKRKAKSKVGAKTIDRIPGGFKSASDYKGRHHTFGHVAGHMRRVRKNRRRRTSKRNPVPAFLRRFGVRRAAVGRRSFARPAARARFLRSHPRVAARVLRNRKRRSYRRNSLALVTNRRRTYRRRRNSLALVTNRKHRKSRKNRKHGRRRNTGMVGATIGKAQGLVGKLPLIGGLLSSALGFIVPVALGAAGVIPTTQLARLVGPYIPNVNASVFYAATGLITAAVVKKFLAKTGIVSQKFADDAAIAIAAGAGAVAVYKMLKGDSKDMGDEYGELEVAMGDLGFATAVAPLGTFAGDDYGDDMGALEVVSGMYNDATVQDAVEAPGDLDYGEIEVALSGPKKWKKKYGKKKGGKSASEQKGHRHGWLIKWIGFENFQKLAAADPAQRQQYIAQMKQAAVAHANQLLGGGSSGASASAGGDMSGYGQPFGELTYAY